MDLMAPVRPRRQQIASATTEFLRDIHSHLPDDPTHVSRNIQIVTLLSEHDGTLRHAFLSENCVSVVTKLLVKLTARHPSEISEEVDRHGAAVQAALWNLYLMLNYGDTTAWMIQALDAKLLLALLRCEPWLPYLAGNEEDCFYWLLTDKLPGYTVYRSVLLVMASSWTSIVQSQMHLNRFSNDSVWTDSWGVFVSRLRSQLELLSSAPQPRSAVRKEPVAISTNAVGV
ncbi:hypothetical protein OE88DRAFT_1664242 [Heliocybe sulcata]|uniref:Uncharacterized protein n=1 Tax=Heliocybe sulcata TaxID=5364 RepID=A0A5C3MTQ2_9AGAM|nr:hypothetical protein OE88DRAFT_1664242 [Heliocybe sulcata]